MLSTVSVLALAIAAQAAPATVPGAAVVGPSQFSVDAIRTGATRNGTASLLKAYRKFGLTPTLPVPEEFIKTLEKRQDGTGVAVSGGGEEYLVSTTVGGQKVNLDFDTGSADLWVFSSEQSASSRSGHNYYTPSSTYKAISGCSWDISYGDGSSASGNCGTDTVSVGATTVKGQVVELATRVSSSFTQDTYSDGLMGLAFSSINTVEPNQASTFFDNAQSSLDSPLFAAYLPSTKNGAYQFGFIDSTKYTGTIAYTAVDNSNGFWEYPSVNYKVGTTVYTQAGRTSISDTGTTLVLMGDTAVKNYYKQVTGSSYSSAEAGYVFPCSSTLPSLSIKIGSNYATIPASLMNFTPEKSGSTCFGALQSVGSGTQNIYGDTFFQANYAVFKADTGNGPSFGFAPIKA